MTKREKARADWLYLQFCEDHRAVKVKSYKLFDESELLVRTFDDKVYLYDVANRNANPRPITLRKDEKVTSKVWLREVGYRIKTKMLMSGVGVEELSDISGLSVITIERYLNGESMPSAINLQKIAIALRCTLNDLTTFPTC